VAQQVAQQVALEAREVCRMLRRFRSR